MAFDTHGQKENGATSNAPNHTMTRFTTSLVASVVFLLTIAVLPVRADDLATGETFSIALIGIPESRHQGESFTVTVEITVFADGTNSPKPVSIRTWIETPLGRAVLSSSTRMLMPGTTTRFSVAFAYRADPGSPAPTEGHPPVPVTIGVTAKLKREILDVSATTLIASGPAPAIALAGQQVPLAEGNGRAMGTTMIASLVDLPDRVYLGADLVGSLAIRLNDDGSLRPRRMHMTTYMDTPLGRAKLQNRKFKMLPVEFRIVPLRYHVSEDAPTGNCTFVVLVMCDGETLVVEHPVYVLGGK